MENLFKLFYETSGVCTDTRTIQEDSLFIALKGANFNGNGFAVEAIAKGAKFSIVDELEYADEKKIFFVSNTLIFLQRLANFHRNKFKIPVIGITGSNGKTTSKELINWVLSKKYNTLCTLGNLNNHIGVPLTLLSLNKNHEIAIIEMGANKPGDIEELVNIAMPNLGIITNVGKAHLEGFKTLEGVIQTKSELFSFIKNTAGSIIYNLDDEIISRQSLGYLNKFGFGKTEKSDVKGKLIELNPYVVLQWRFENYISPEIETKLVGSYNFYNFLASIAFGVYFKVPFEKINEAISSFTPNNKRSQVLKTDKNTLIVDCYNANPSSMMSALESFVCNNLTNKLVILGDMLELGSETVWEHTQVLNYCHDNKLDVITVGTCFSNIEPKSFSSSDQLYSFISKNPIENRTILLKGSRGIKLEKIIELL